MHRIIICITWIYFCSFERLCISFSNLALILFSLQLIGGNCDFLMEAAEAIIVSLVHQALSLSVILSLSIGEDLSNRITILHLQILHNHFLVEASIGGTSTCIKCQYIFFMHGHLDPECSHCVDSQTAEAYEAHLGASLIHAFEGVEIATNDWTDDIAYLHYRDNDEGRLNEEVHIGGVDEPCTQKFVLCSCDDFL